jgi:hypothetical protein
MRTFFAFDCAGAIEFTANKGMQRIAGHILARNPHPPIQFDRSASTLIRLLFIGPLCDNPQLLKAVFRCGPRARCTVLTRRLSLPAPPLRDYLSSGMPRDWAPSDALDCTEKPHELIDSTKLNRKFGYVLVPRQCEDRRDNKGEGGSAPRHGRRGMDRVKDVTPTPSGGRRS